MSAKFPQRMLELLQQMAAEMPDAGHGGPWQYADGSPMQKDAQAALEWIGGAFSDRSIAHGARQVVAQLQDSPKSALSTLTSIVQEAEVSTSRKAMRPMNGTKTHPLSAHACAELRDIARKPVPRSAVNPGVADRLLRESLVEEVNLPSPFKTHKGKAVAHLRITSAGQAIITT